MSEIPEDIREAAARIAEICGGKVMQKDASHEGAFVWLYESAAIDVIATALLAERMKERGRCARLAEGEAHEDCSVSEQIAKLIRSGS